MAAISAVKKSGGALSALVCTAQHVPRPGLYATHAALPLIHRHGAAGRCELLARLGPSATEATVSAGTTSPAGER